MVEKIQLTHNYKDLSTDKGFQFDLFNDRCGNGFRSSFKTPAIGTISGALGAASGLFGELFSPAA
jgi:hypothetical protein